MSTNSTGRCEFHTKGCQFALRTIKGNSSGIFKQRLLLPMSMLSKMVPMITQENDDGIVV